MRAVDNAAWGDHFIRPLYDSYCFSRIPELLLSLFGGGDDGDVQAHFLGPLAGRYDTVILCLIDAFGWRFVQQFGDRYPFLRRILTDGYVTKLTSQFPSTTAAHVTTIHTGIPVGESGVYEWFYYEPALDAVIAPLLYSFAGDRDRNTLAPTGVTPDSIYPTTTLYHALADLGVRSTVFQAQEAARSAFTSVVCRGATIVPYVSLHGGVEALAASVLGARERTYHFLYYGGIDSAGHHCGSASREFADQVDVCLRELESVLYERLSGRTGNSLLLMTADHGMTDVPTSATTFLNLELPQVREWIVAGRRGDPLVPAGSPRDLFLHLKEEHLAEATTRIGEALSGRAEVHLVGDLIAEGFFGGAAPSPAFLSRAANVVVLSYEGECVWWHDPPRFTQPFIGHHGGLSRNEMETELLALPL